MNCRITFYDVVECGYYRYSQEMPDFGNFHTLIPQLGSWVRQEGLSLGDTCTYDLPEQNDVLRTFCFDMASSLQGSYLVTTWNETASMDGKAATVDTYDRVGEATVHLTDLPDNEIPGYPTYFWLFPEDNLLSTVTFNTPLNGHPNFDRFMNGFLERYSRHVVLKDSSDSVKILGYVEKE